MRVSSTTIYTKCSEMNPRKSGLISMEPGFLQASLSLDFNTEKGTSSYLGFSQLKHASSLFLDLTPHLIFLTMWSFWYQVRRPLPRAASLLRHLSSVQPAIFTALVGSHTYLWPLLHLSGVTERSNELQNYKQRLEKWSAGHTHTL